MATSNNTALFYNVTATGNLADSDAKWQRRRGGLFNGMTAATLVNSILAATATAAVRRQIALIRSRPTGYNLIGDDAGCAITPAAAIRSALRAAPDRSRSGVLAVAENGVALHRSRKRKPGYRSAESGGAR